METIHITLPNSPDNFLLIEMCERLKAGQMVTMLFGGTSMLPLINGRGDKIRLHPLAEDEQMVVGNVYLFLHCNHYVIHRLMRIKGSELIFRGDNCVAYEHVVRENVLARLVAVEKVDGSLWECDGGYWQKQSRIVLRKKWLKSVLTSLVHERARRKLAVVYFILLAILMWAPINGLGDVLSNYIFGLRVDHFLHASIYLMCPFFLADWLKKRPVQILLCALAIGLLTESVQYLLPYRGYDVNDLVANCFGNLIGWAVILPRLIAHNKYIRNLQK